MSKRESELIQLMRDVCDELGLSEEKQEHAPILEALNVAFNKGAESAQPAEKDGWVSCDGDAVLPRPEVDSFAWVVWNGTMQDQPWQWVDGADDEDRFSFDGHTLFLDEIDAYWPIKLPAPPQPKDQK